jgi:hypothetical protein
LLRRSTSSPSTSEGSAERAFPLDREPRFPLDRPLGVAGGLASDVLFRELTQGVNVTLRPFPVEEAVRTLSAPMCESEQDRRARSSFMPAA